MSSQTRLFPQPAQKQVSPKAHTAQLVTRLLSSRQQLTLSVTTGASGQLLTMQLAPLTAQKREFALMTQAMLKQEKSRQQVTIMLLPLPILLARKTVIPHIPARSAVTVMLTLMLTLSVTPGAHGHMTTQTKHTPASAQDWAVQSHKAVNALSQAKLRRTLPA